jgi:transposase
VTTAATLVAVIGDVRRFPTARHLVGYLGLHPTVRQSGNGPARHGRMATLSDPRPEPNNSLNQDKEVELIAA